MTAHTKGLLATFEVGDNGNLAIGSEDKTSLLTIVDEDGIDFAALYHAADARRLAACWNLLDGYPTAELEGVTLAEFVASHPELAEKALIAAYASIFAERGAANYLEVKGARPELGPFTITLQRTEGLTPVEKLEAVTKQRDAAYVMAGKSGLERDKFAQQLKAANRKIAAMAELLRGASPFLDYVQSGACHISNDDVSEAIELSDRIAAALAGELPDHFAGAGKMVELNAYDAGYLNDFGGGNVGWWHDYIRSELDRAHDFYQSQLVDGNHVEQTLAMAPEGWQLVPVEPNVQMLAAFVEAGGKAISGYKAMLAAAPKPQGGAPCNTGLPSSKSD